MVHSSIGRKVEQQRRAEQVCISGRDVEGADLLALVLPRRQLLVGIWNLKPGTRGLKIQVQRVSGGGVKVNPIEGTLSVALIVKVREFRGVQNAAAVYKVACQEVSSFLSARSKGEVRGLGAKRSIFFGKGAVRRCVTQSRAADRIDHHAVFVTVLRQGYSGYNLQRLNGIQRNLVRKDFTVLVCNGLVIERNLGFGVITQRVKEAVGIRHHQW